MTNILNYFIHAGDAEITSTSILLIVVLASVLGLLIAAGYKYTYRGTEYSQEFAVTLVLLCVIISLVVSAIGSNVARAFSFAGALSIIRFRTAVANPRDIAFILFSVSSGLCVGVGVFFYAAIAVVFILLLIFVMNGVNAFAPKTVSKRLKITIAENMNYEHVFEGILDKYCTAYILKRVSSIDLGTLFELIFDIELKVDASEKELLDEIRCKNGNLHISLLLAEDKTLR